MVRTYEKNGTFKLSDNFRLSEFACKCSRCGEILLDDALVEILQRIRDHFDAPVDINSGYRCEMHNAEVGGDPRSSHMQGMAADIVVRGIDPEEVAKYAESIGVKRIGLYGDDDGNFVHIGSGVTKRFWLGHAGTVVETFGGAKAQVCTVSVPVLKRGARNGAVTALQLLLQGYTNPRLAADGSFGPATELEVREFQRKRGMTEDGSVGPATWKELLGV